MLAERLEPMARDFSETVHGVGAAGRQLLASSREANDAVRAAFDRYDAAMRLLLRTLASPGPAHPELEAACEVAVAAIEARPEFNPAPAAAAAAASSKPVSSPEKVDPSGAPFAAGGKLCGAECDAWLAQLRWQTAVAWQPSLWRETTRRFRAK